MVRLTANPVTGEPDAGELLVWFGGMGGANLATPTPINASDWPVKPVSHLDRAGRTSGSRPASNLGHDHRSNVQSAELQGGVATVYPARVCERAGFGQRCVSGGARLGAGPEWGHATQRAIEPGRDRCGRPGRGGPGPDEQREYCGVVRRGLGACGWHVQAIPPSQTVQRLSQDAG